MKPLLQTTLDSIPPSPEISKSKLISGIVLGLSALLVLSLGLAKSSIAVQILLWVIVGSGCAYVAFVPLWEWGKRSEPTLKNIEEELANRDLDDVKSLWNVNWRLCESIQMIINKELGWEHTTFIPEDSMSVVLWSHEDGLDAECAVSSIRQELEIALPDSELNNFLSLSFGEFIELIKTRSNHGLESTGAPPAAGTPETHP